MRSRWRRWILVAALGWLGVAALILLLVAPHWPRTWREWGLLLAVGPPAYAAGEFAVHRALTAIERSRLARAARWAVLLLVAVAAFLLVILLGWAVDALTSKS